MNPSDPTTDAIALYKTSTPEQINAFFTGVALSSPDPIALEQHLSSAAGILQVGLKAVR